MAEDTQSTDDELRKHHYTPAFYLAGFTLRGRKRDYLCALDLTTLEMEPRKPKQVGHERDFYRIKATGAEAVAVERALQDLEDKMGPVLHQIITGGRLPTGEQFDWLIAFIALSRVRVPREREVNIGFLRDIGQRMLELMVEDRGRWERALARATGDEPHSDANTPDYESIRRMVKEGELTVGIEPSWTILHMFEDVNTLIPLLAARKWSLLQAKDDAGDFVCSDCPVALAWTKPTAPSFYGPGFGLPGTDVTMPLSRKLALIGRFEGTADMVTADRALVAALNVRTIFAGRRSVFSPREDFPFWTPAGQVGGAADLLTLLREKRSTDDQEQEAC